MPITVNLRHLEEHPVRVQGELPAGELDVEIRDEIVQLGPPLEYDFEVQKLEHSLLVQGKLRLRLQCQCVRCLKSFELELKLDPWTLHIPLQGEDAAPVNNDCVDLTPFVREDILLEFPQHPLCQPECRGLPKTNLGKAKHTSSGPAPAGSPAWEKLNKLKF